MRLSAMLTRSAFILGALALLLSGTPGFALARSVSLPVIPRAGQLTVHLEPPILSAYPQVSAYMSVLGADGQPVINLNQNDVTVTIDGTPVQLQGLSSVINVGETITASILLDTSGSMQGEKLADAKSAIITFGQNLGEQDQVALYQVAGGPGGVKKILDFTKDHSKLANAINPLQANGETPIYDAVYQAAQDLASVQGRKLIILQTDGEDTTSQHSIDEAISLAQQLHLPVYTIGLGLGTDQKARDALQKISSETGGAFFDAPQPSQLTATYQQILTQLRQSYLLTVSSPVQVDSNAHTLKVSVKYQGNAYSDSTTFHIQAVVPQLSASLHSGQQVVGTADFSVNVQGNATPIRSVTVEIDGKPFASAKGNPPYHFSWNIRYVLPGAHKIHIQVVDLIGNKASLDVTVQVGVEWSYWIGLLIDALLIVLALIVLRFARYRFLGSQLEGMLVVRTIDDRKAEIELGHDVKGSRLRLRITPSGVRIGAYPPWKKFLFVSAAKAGPEKPIAELPAPGQTTTEKPSTELVKATKPQKTAKAPKKVQKRVTAWVYVKVEKENEKGVKSRLVMPYFHQKGKKRPVELSDKWRKKVGNYIVEFTE